MAKSASVWEELRRAVEDKKVPEGAKSSMQLAAELQIERRQVEAFVKPLLLSGRLKTALFNGNRYYWEP